MSIIMTPQLEQEYRDLFASCQVRPEKAKQVGSVKDKIVGNRTRYANVEAITGVPWFVIGAIHNLEGSLNFNTHLHNGDPLTARTVHVPKGRPVAGKPPFRWEDSAVDALQFDNLTSLKKWTLPATLFKLEGFNGFGYRTRHPDVLTPYLWSFSNHYTKGKFVRDRVFDPNATSNQCGAATIFLVLVKDGTIVFP